MWSSVHSLLVFLEIVMAGESRLVREIAMEAGIKALFSDSRAD